MWPRLEVAPPRARSSEELWAAGRAPLSARELERALEQQLRPRPVRSPLQWNRKQCLHSWSTVERRKAPFLARVVVGMTAMNALIARAVPVEDAHTTMTTMMRTTIKTTAGLAPGEMTGAMLDTASATVTARPCVDASLVTISRAFPLVSRKNWPAEEVSLQDKPRSCVSCPT